MMDFVESLAPIQQVGVVSCRSDVMPIYEGRGYVAVRRDPLNEHVPMKTLTRNDLEYVIMIKNKSGLPIPSDLNFKSSSSYKSHTNWQVLLYAWMFQVEDMLLCEKIQ